MLWAVLSAVLLQVSQTPPRDAAPPGERPAGTGVISGHVVSPDGVPLRGMYVTLVFVDGPSTPRHLETDVEGRFQFTALAKGTYRLRAMPSPYRGQYVSGGFGARRQGELGRTIELAEGQKVTQATIVLPRGGVIPGRVVDEYGDPVSRVMVFTLRVTSAGEQFQRRGMAAQTDDQGRFRLFGLEPGEYVVAAESRGMGGPPIEGGTEGFVTTYYPSALAEREAARVRVTAGADAAEVQIQLVRTRTFRIAGMVMDSKGQPVSSPNVMLVHASGNTGFTNHRGSSMDGGTFTFRNVAAGEYRLVVRPWMRPGPPQPGSEQRHEYATVPLSVAADIDDLVVVTQPGVSIAGQIVFAEGAPRVIPPLDVRAGPPDPAMMFGPATPARPDRNGRFTLTDLFGPQLVRATGRSEYTLKAVMLGGTDITDTPVEFKAEHSGHLQVVVTARGSTLEGIVTDDSGAPATDAMVLMVPEERTSWRLGSPRLRTSVLWNEGRYRAENVLAVPRESIQLSPDMEPELFEKLIRDATTVVVAEDETRTIDLRLIKRAPQ